jgi:DNA-binding NarL/FixJ family response regulator
MKSNRRTAARPLFSTARAAFFQGDFEDCLRICESSTEKGVEIELLHCRALIALNLADRALERLRRLHVRVGATDESVTARMLEGAALVKLGRLTEGISMLTDVQADTRGVHDTIRAELAVNLGIAHYREMKFPEALCLLRSVPDDADIVRARATLFEGWIAFDACDVNVAADRFRAALRCIASCRQYDRFIDASALYGLAFLCAEVPLPDLWPEVRDRAIAFDWSRTGIAIPLFLLAVGASYATELRGEGSDAVDWALRAESIAPSPCHEIIALLRLASLVGRSGESRAHAYFVRKASAQYEALRRDALLQDDLALPVMLAEELAYAGAHDAAMSLLTYHEAVITRRVRGTKDEGMLHAAWAMTRAVIDEASGQRARAQDNYATALRQYDLMGYQRRAAIAAYRLASLTREERYRAYAEAALHDVSPNYWLRERLAEFGLREIRLTSRHADVLRLVAAGKSNKEIALARGGSWYTARNIVRELLVLFGAQSRAELVRVAIARGVLPGPERPRPSEGHMAR